jgi:CubicO group peptidase (beta-lactamase class C family)
MNAPLEWYAPASGFEVLVLHRTLWIVAATLFLTSLHAPELRGQTREPVKGVEDSALEGLVRPDEPGFAELACLGVGGRNCYTRVEGVRDLRSRTKIDAHTNFRLASFTKQFTAMAIMLLVHDGKLRYDDTLAEILPDFPAYGKLTTIRNLLNHTSGLPDYEDLMDAVEKVNGPIWTPEKQIQDGEVLELLKKEKSGKFAPGTSWSYSNSAYVVLGLIVAKVSGKSYGAFLHERIFAPLKMNHTIVFQKGKNQIVNRAFGHSKENGALKETDQSATSATLGDGGIYSNLEDLTNWDAALQYHTLLSEKEMQPALTPVKLNDGSEPRWPLESNDDNLHPGKPVSYGFGWFLDSNQGHPRMWHTGTTMGFRTVIERFTEGGLTVIILCNRTDLDPEKLALQIAGYYPPLK